MHKKLYINNLTSIIYQITTVLIGLILPRMILNTYGSEANGLISSITQMLGFISILDLGVGAVVQAALYKPLSFKEKDKISLIYSSAKKYFNIIAKALIIYIFILCVYYCTSNSNHFSNIYTISLIVAISISSFAQYYFGICNTLLITADQKIYINVIINLLALILSAIISIILMYYEYSIQIVKLASSLIFLMRPILLSIYVKKNYDIKIIKNPPKNVLPQKWNGLAQHISTVLTGQIDFIVLTMFSTFKSISIYNVYILPLMGIRVLIESFSTSYKSFFGKLIADSKIDELNMEFEKYENIMHFVVVVVFSCTVHVIIPFALLYTVGVTDTNYNQPFFSAIITLSYALYALRIPYTTIIFSAGHFKQTQLYSIIECLLNIIFSIIFVSSFDISGAALGTCIAVSYRLFISAYYLKNEIIKRRYIVFLKLILKDVIAVVIITFISKYVLLTDLSIIGWIIYSFKIFIICIIVTSLIFLINNNNINKFINKITAKVKN